MSDTLRTVLLTGKPGSGKGTQAKMLAEKRGWIHFSTGNRFRELREEKTPLGERVREVYDTGRLMPDWFATFLLQESLLTLDPEKGIVIEGYPRSLAQAEIFDDIMDWLGRPYTVLDLAVRDEEVTDRMLKRAAIENRPDSATREQIEVRLAAYEEHTAPVLDFFREKGKLAELDGEKLPEEVEAEIHASLAA